MDFPRPLLARIAKQNCSSKFPVLSHNTCLEYGANILAANDFNIFHRIEILEVLRSVILSVKLSYAPLDCRLNISMVLKTR